MRVAVGICVEDTLMIQSINPYPAGSVNHLSFAVFTQDDSDMSHFTFLVVKKAQITCSGFFNKSTVEIGNPEKDLIVATVARIDLLFFDPLRMSD